MVCGLCCVLVVFCMACSSHHFVHTKPPPLSPFSSPFTTPLFCLSVCVWKRVWTRKWMVWNGVWCVACNTSATVLSSSHHQPLCVSGPSPFPSHSQTPLLPSFLVWFVWTERVKDKWGLTMSNTLCTTSNPHHTLSIQSCPLFNEHMVDLFVMHQNTFHPSMVLCPLLMHKPFPPHSLLCHSFSPFNTPTTTSFLLLPFPIPFPFTSLMPCHHSTLFQSIHVLIVFFCSQSIFVGFCQ